MNTESSSYLGDRITIDPDICNGKLSIRGKPVMAGAIMESSGFLADDGGFSSHRAGFRGPATGACAMRKAV